MNKIYTIIALFTISFMSSQTMFFSEYAEGSSANKYLEIYNPTANTIDLTEYSYPSVANAPTTAGEPEYWNAFPAGASIAPGGLYIICHGSADPYITNVGNHTHTYLSNGDDGYALVHGTDAADFAAKGSVILDVIGQSIFDNTYADPGSGWAVAGVANGTKDHTLVRKATVTTGNAGNWAASAGTDANDSEWIVLNSDDWSYLNAPGETLTISNFDGVDVNVYPNPVHAKLNFSGLSSSVQATIYDMLGKRQLQSQVINSLDVSHLKSGLYMVEIKNENSSKVFNILKK